MSRPSTPRLRLLLALHTKGVADPASLGAACELDDAAVDDELARSIDADLVTVRPGRTTAYALTPEGRFLLRRLVRDELDQPTVRDEISGAYQQFLGINGDLLDVCTAWQLRPGPDGDAVNTHDDAEYDGLVIDRLVAVHERMRTVLDRLAGSLGRFDRYRRGLENALDRLTAGDHDYFTRPMFPSYHSVWFELHEDLLVTLDTDRRHERSHPT